jgi:RNA polymerase sigma-70 factor, ECF subfamily
MQATSDEALIARIASGDRLAMQVLFARHHVRIYRFVLRLVRDHWKAEDLISEVFLDVWRQADRFEGRSTVSTWLLAIARFKALSALRRKPEEGLDEDAALAIEDPADNPEETAKSSISSTTTRNRSKRSPRSSESPRTPSKRECSMRARNWQTCSKRRDWSKSDHEHD